MTNEVILRPETIVSHGTGIVLAEGRVVSIPAPRIVSGFDTSEIRAPGQYIAVDTSSALREELDEEEFAELADQWHVETAYLSSPSQIASHPNYLEIIAWREHALPFILEDLRRRGGEWYRALRAITRSLRIDPPTLTEADLANSRRVQRAWLEWGERHGYIAG